MLNMFLILIGTVSVLISLVSLWRQYQEGFQNFEWLPIILKSVVTWIVFALIGITNTVVNLVQASRAFQGRLPGRSLTSALVDRLIKRPVLNAN